MSGEKTEKATPKKVLDLRKKGQIARSAELSAGIGLVVTVALLPGALARLSEVLEVGMVDALSSAPPDLATATRVAWEMLRDAALVLAPLVGALALASVLSAVLLGRSAPNLWVLRALKMRVSPKVGIRRIFSAQTAFDLVRSSAKLLLLGAVAWGSWRAGSEALLAGPGTLEGLVAIVRSSTGEMLVRVALLALAVGLVDAWWSRRQFDKQAKMSKQDVKDESKTREGSPEVKMAIRARQAKLSRSRMIAAVAGADVVLANPTHVVVALRYEPGTAAPVVVAKGAGVVADRIKAEAATHDVPVVEDKPLARAVYRATEVGDPVPVEFYRAVAEVLAMVYSTRRRARRVAA